MRLLFFLMSLVFISCQRYGRVFTFEKFAYERGTPTDTLTLRFDSHIPVISYYENGKPARASFFYKSGRVRSTTYYDTINWGVESMLIYHKNGRIKYQIAFHNSQLNGETWVFSRSGKLEAVYLYNNDKFSKVLFAINKRYSQPDSTFTPARIAPLIR